MGIKSDQHFVWQYYMKRWINEKGKLYALDVKENRLINVKSNNICFQKFIYSIEGLTWRDLELLKIIFVNEAPEFEKNMNIRWLAPFFLLINTQEKLKSLKKEEGIKELDLMSKDILEDVYCKIEQAGKDGLDELNDGNNSLIVDMNRYTELYVFLLFVHLQYFRTANVKNKMIESSFAQKYFENSSAIQPILALILANNVCLKVILEIGETRFCHLLKNDTKIDFVTSDQPVIFIKDHLQSRNSLYYPLSPKSALLINSAKEVCNAVDEEMVNYYNQEMVRVADRHVIGLKRGTLENLKLTKNSN